MRSPAGRKKGNRDKASLDIFWLRDKSLEDSDNLPDPDVLAQEIVVHRLASLLGTTSKPPSRLVELRVADTGVGIPKDKLDLIFDKFYQVDSSETRLYGGVGLGLYIAKQFAEMLGGEISLESEVGKGTTFTVRLPA